MHYLKKHLEECVVNYLESQIRFVLVEKAPFLIKDLYDDCFYKVIRLSKCEFDEKKKERFYHKGV